MFYPQFLCIFTLRANAGSILDKTIELDILGDLEGLPLTPFQQDLINRGLANEDALRYPVSPGLYSSLFPNASFLGLTPPLSTPEIFNVVGEHVTLIADGGGRVGRSGDAFVINLSGGYDGLTTDAKKILSTSTPDDVIGAQYSLYRYVGLSGAPGDHATLLAQNFSDGSRWEKLEPTYVTGTSKAAPIVRSLSDGTTVLVEFNKNDYGLYTYTGPSISADLRWVNYADTNHWNKVIADRSTDDGSSADLQNGQLVLSKLTVERLAMQLQPSLSAIYNCGFRNADCGM